MQLTLATAEFANQVNKWMAYEWIQLDAGAQL